MKKSTAICSIWLACASFAALPLTTNSVSAKPHTPARGSSERTSILNSLRRVLGSGRHKAIITPYHFKVEKGWAYIGGGFNYENAKLEERYTEGSGTNFSALLRRENGSWRVKRRIYNGDVAEPEFIRAFPQAPKAIFRMN